MWQSATSCQHHTGPGIHREFRIIRIHKHKKANSATKSTAALLFNRKFRGRSLKMEKEINQTVLFRWFIIVLLYPLSNIEVQSISILSLLLVLPKYTGSPGDISLIPGTARCFHFHSTPNCCRKKSCCSCRVITWTYENPLVFLKKALLNPYFFGGGGGR